MNSDPLRRSPSRKTCEEIIRRILMTEVLEQGTNSHFKTAADFMNYFESLYPAGPGLTKQVQRAVKSLNMPKDSNGYFIINKTRDQLDRENEISDLFKKADCVVDDLEEQYETLFLKTDPFYRDYIMSLLSASDSFRDKFITIVSSSEGLLFYTRNKSQLSVLLNSLLR